jgi:hypothetical protein
MLYRHSSQIILWQIGHFVRWCFSSDLEHFEQFKGVPPGRHYIFAPGSPPAAVFLTPRDAVPILPLPGKTTAA